MANSKTTRSGVETFQRPNWLKSSWLLLLLIVLLLAIVASVALGVREVSIEDIFSAFAGEKATFEEAAVYKRIPRTVLALIIGAALGLSGAVMQGVTRNPLADPGILGVNTGAALAVAIGVAGVGLTTHTEYIWVAILGAAVTAVFVYSIASLGRGGATPLKLALAGAATSTALASFITAVVLGRNDIASLLRSWQIGGVGGANFEVIFQVLPFLLVGTAISLLSARSLNSLALGDELAAGLGEKVAVARAVASLGSVILCGAATAIAGPIGFVGLVIPHLIRLLIGVDHRWLLPFSALGGAILLLVADTLGRILGNPSEIDVGIITALVGAPFFIYIVRNQKVKEL